MLKNKVQRYSIRKLSVGAASVLIGMAFLSNSNNVKADEVEKDVADKQPAVVDESKQAVQAPAYDKDKVVVEKADTNNDSENKQVESDDSAENKQEGQVDKLSSTQTPKQVKKEQILMGLRNFTPFRAIAY